MTKRNFILFFFYITFTLELIFSSPCFSSFEIQGAGARFQAMGGTSAAFANTPDAVFGNCSGLALASGYQFSFYYSKPFGIKELNHGTFSSIIPMKIGTLGVASKTFGNKLYSENEVIVSYANSIRRKVYYGISLRYLRLDISRYGSDSAIGIDIGLITNINSRIKWGFFSHNINRPNISSKKESLPQIFSTGFSIRPIKNSLISFDIYKDVKFPVEYKFGFEYLLLNRFAIRSGFISDPAQFTAGFGAMFSFVNIDYAFQTHNDLGLSHQFSLTIALRRRKDVQKFDPDTQNLKLEKNIDKK